jgi:hypothetical protein
VLPWARARHTDGVTTVHVVLSAVALVESLAAAAWGAVCWRRGQTAGFWPLLRACQVALVLQAAWGGVLLLDGREDPGSLHALYGVLPVAIMFFGEQFRISAAQQVLDARGLADGRAVGRLPEVEQRFVVLAIVRREVAVMALAAFVCLLLGLRAWTTAGG